MIYVWQMPVLAWWRCWSLSSHVAVTWALLVILDTKDLTSIPRWQLCALIVVEESSTSCMSVLTAGSSPMASSSVCPFAAINCHSNVTSFWTHWVLSVSLGVVSRPPTPVPFQGCLWTYPSRWLLSCFGQCVCVRVFHRLGNLWSLCLQKALLWSAVGILLFNILIIPQILEFLVVFFLPCSSGCVIPCLSSNSQIPPSIIFTLLLRPLNELQTSDILGFPLGYFCFYF